jgi:hypothetical protein
LATAFPEFRSQRYEMGSGRGWHPATCRYPVCATVPTANCGAGGPRFGLACQASTQRREEVAAALYDRALTAIGNSLGKRKRRFDLLPAHAMCTPEMACAGSCGCLPCVRVSRVHGRAEHRSMGFSRLASTRGYAARQRPAADSRICWPRRCCQTAGRGENTGATACESAYPPSSWLTPDCVSECLREFARYHIRRARPQA